MAVAESATTDTYSGAHFAASAAALHSAVAAAYSIDYYRLSYYNQSFVYDELNFADSHSYRLLNR